MLVSLGLGEFARTGAEACLWDCGLPSPAEAESFINENQFATVDDAGRVIAISGERGDQSIRALDPRTGRSTQVCP